MTAVYVRVEGVLELKEKLQAFASGDMDLTRGMRATGLFLTRFFSGEVFASRGGAISEPWPGLSDKYAAYKARKFPGAAPLIKTGVMNRSFKHRATPLTTELYNTAEYFDYHQDGEGVPQRMMMKLDEQRAARVVKFILADITTQMDKAGLL